jgi:hypothetical protein
MSDFNEHTEKDSSMSTLILIAVIILALLYFLAKGCTNRDENQGAPASHGTGMNVKATGSLTQC